MIKQIKLSEVHAIVSSISPNIDTCIRKMLDFYMSKIIEKHFNFGNVQKYGIKPLSPSYAIKKLKKYGPKPVLVASGKLKSDVLVTYKVVRTKRDGYVIRMNIPQYGDFQIKAGRDWLSPSKSDNEEMLKYFLKEFKKLRNK